MRKEPHYWFSVWWSNSFRDEANYFEIRARDQKEAIEITKDFLVRDRAHVRWHINIDGVYQIYKNVL